MKRKRPQRFILLPLCLPLGYLFFEVIFSILFSEPMPAIETIEGHGSSAGMINAMVTADPLLLVFASLALLCWALMLISWLQETSVYEPHVKGEIILALLAVLYLVVVPGKVLRFWILLPFHRESMSPIVLWIFLISMSIIWWLGFHRLFLKVKKKREERFMHGYRKLKTRKSDMYA